MPPISEWHQALTVLLVIIPGFVYQGLLARFRGPIPEDSELARRLLRSLAASGLFAIFYVIVFGSFVKFETVSSRATYVDHPVRVALVLLGLIFVFPAFVAVLHHGYVVKRQRPDLPCRDYFRVYNPTPTAWDWAVKEAVAGYVRVLTKDGKWFGGYVGELSFYTSHTGAREIFAESAWELDENGEFLTEIKNNAGRWIQCADAVVVEFIRPDDPASPEQEQPSASIISRLTGDALAGAVFGAAAVAIAAIAIGERFRRRSG